MSRSAGSEEKDKEEEEDDVWSVSDDGRKNPGQLRAPPVDRRGSRRTSSRAKPDLDRAPSVQSLSLQRPSRTTQLMTRMSVNNDGVEEQVAVAIPEDYFYDPFAAEPSLDHLRSLDHQTATLVELVQAADADVLLHSARIRAVLLDDPSLVETYSPDTDPQWQERKERRRLRRDTVESLEHQKTFILQNLDQGPSKKHMTQGEITRERLLRWQRALELYVHCGAFESDMNLLRLLEKLCEGCSDEEELSEALYQATQMCNGLVDSTSLAVQDATEDAAEAEDAYHIRLEAHALLARRATRQSEDIEDQFRTNGRAALRIGQQLELAEAKLRQCDGASNLIRRWWMMEQLAEQEDMSGDEISVMEEVRGLIPTSSCRMDALFTRPEHSLEAARTLKALRAVVKSRGNAATGSSLLDPNSVRRFDLTHHLIQRTSAALEARLLNSFSETFIKGGQYDFSSPLASSRPGRLDWMQLREWAEALMNFDSGRSLHKRYVQIVVTTRLPELFAETRKDNSDSESVQNASNSEEEEEEYDENGDLIDRNDFEYKERKRQEKIAKQEEEMDQTRSKLSTLFHRVSEVCTAEFQLIAHVFSPGTKKQQAAGTSSMHEGMTVQVARALLGRVISDPRNGLQARITELLESIDRKGDFDAGAKKLDTFVVIHEKAAGLFSLLREAAERMLIFSNFDPLEGLLSTLGPSSPSNTNSNDDLNGPPGVRLSPANARAVASLVQFLTSQEISLSNGHRRGYLNLELRLLHHECCDGLNRIGMRMLKPRQPRESLFNRPSSNKNAPPVTGASLAEYKAPLLPLDKNYLKKQGFAGLLNGPLKPSMLRQPLVHATESLARSHLMFGGGEGGGGGDRDSTARVISAIYSQMCSFYGEAFLFPLVESIGEMLTSHPPSAPPQLPFDEDQPPHDMGVDYNFWQGMERIHSAAKAFDRELWAEQRAGSARVYEILAGTGSQTSLSIAKDRRIRFFGELESRGEAAILRALETLSVHIQWILVTGGESMLASGGTRILQSITGQISGPYAMPHGSSLDAPNSPAVKSLTYCLRAQFVQIQAALTPQSLSSFWTSLSMRLYDILVARLLQYYYVSTVGAVILSRDVEALRSVAMLAGNDHSHWDTLRELLTLYMTPPDALKSMLVGPEGDINSGKGLFARAGRDQCIVFMSRRVDYRYKTSSGPKKSGWASALWEEIGVYDISDGTVNIGRFAAENQKRL